MGTAGEEDIEWSTRKRCWFRHLSPTIVVICQRLWRASFLEDSRLEMARLQSTMSVKRVWSIDPVFDGKGILVEFATDASLV